MGYEDLKTEVEKNGGVHTITMERLRDAHGAGKLGVHVRKEISNALAGIGLGHVPADLPQYQEDQVRLYKLGSTIADIIHASLKPGPAFDSTLKELANQDVARHAETIEKIRALVNE